MTDVQGIAAGQLKSIVERIERLEDEIREMNVDKSDIYKEAKSNGFDTAALRKIVAERRKDASVLEEQNSIMDLYRIALGMVPADPEPSRVHVHEGPAFPATNDGGAHEVAPIADISKVNAPEPSDTAASAAVNEIADRCAPPYAPSTSLPGTEADADPAPFALADARLISRVTAARRKGLPVDEAGDSARYQRLVKSGALVLAAGRLFNPTLAPVEEFA